MKLNEIHANSTAYTRVDFDAVSKWMKDNTGQYVTMSGTSKGISIGQAVNVSNKGITKVPFHVYKCSTKWDLSNNNIRTLEDCGLPAEVPCIDISHNPITSLIGISDMVKNMAYAGGYSEAGKFIAIDCPIEKGGIGLLLIPSIREIIVAGAPVVERAFKIICKYIDKPNQIFECQNELIENDLEAYADV